MDDEQTDERTDGQRERQGWQWLLFLSFFLTPSDNAIVAVSSDGSHRFHHHQQMADTLEGKTDSSLSGGVSIRSMYAHIHVYLRRQIYLPCLSGLVVGSCACELSNSWSPSTRTFVTIATMTTLDLTVRIRCRELEN